MSAWRVVASGAYQYDQVWYSDDGGQTYALARNASGNGQPATIWQQDEIALAEASVSQAACTPPGFPRARMPRCMDVFACARTSA